MADNDEAQAPANDENVNQGNFMLNPGSLNPNQVIDYSTRTGQSLYLQAIKALSCVFDGKTSTIAPFLHAVRDRSHSAGWTDIFDISVDTDSQGQAVFKNLLTEHGEITLENVTQNALDDYIGMQTRNAQVSQQIYHCLTASVTSEVTQRMVVESDKYYLGDPEVPDGPCFLKRLIDIYSIQTNSTITDIRLELAEATTIMADKEYDIDKFTTTIKRLQLQLTAHGATTEDLFAHLTKAYLSVPDDSFRTYIGGKIDSHNDSTSPLTVDQLMNFAKTKYDELKKSGTWLKTNKGKAPRYLSMSARLQQAEKEREDLQKKLAQLQIRREAQQRTTVVPRTPRSPALVQNSRNDRRPNGSRNKWAWKKVRGNTRVRTKEFEGKTYHWCGHHNQWTLHQEANCRLAPGNGNANATPRPIASHSAVLEFDAGHLDDL